MGDPREVPPADKSGPRRVRAKRVRGKGAQARYFRVESPGVLSAKLVADEPETPLGRALVRARGVVFGRPLASEAEITERLPKWKALPVFSSDALSSVAYGPEAAMYALLGAGTIALAWLMPIVGAILVVLLLLTLSYRQTIAAYPNGGGSYIVARANLGEAPGLVAAAALLADYVLTVSVSVSAGVVNLTSAFPTLQPLHVPLVVAAILSEIRSLHRGPRTVRRAGRFLLHGPGAVPGATGALHDERLLRMVVGAAETPHARGKL